MNELALFAGAGGGILGGKLLGWRTVCAVEYNAYAASILIQRQNEKLLEPFPVWNDVRTFDGRGWRGIVDVVSGGFPCQDISFAKGPKAQGIHGSKSGLWKEMVRIISEVRSSYVFVENSAAITSRGLGVVLGDLAKMGYNARWGVFSAADVGARHQRERMWIVANLRNTNQNPTQTKPVLSCKQQEFKPLRTLSEGLSTKPAMGRRADGLANWMDRLEAIGNGQVPAVAAFAWEILNSYKGNDNE